MFSLPMLADNGNQVLFYVLVFLGALLLGGAILIAVGFVIVKPIAVLMRLIADGFRVDLDSPFSEEGDRQ